MKRIFFFFFIILLTGVVLGIFFWYAQKQNNNPVIGKATPVNKEHIDNESLTLGENYARYTSQEFLFSVEYPKELSASIVAEEHNAATMVFQEHDTTEKPPREKIGFQIFVTPFGEEEILTKERIREDVPSAHIENATSIIINPDVPGEKEIQALLFSSEDTVLGKTIEVWFTKNGYLYEVTAPEHMNELLPKILSSWRALNPEDLP